MDAEVTEERGQFRNEKTPYSRVHENPNFFIISVGFFFLCKVGFRKCYYFGMGSPKHNFPIKKKDGLPKKWLTKGKEGLVDYYYATCHNSSE